MTTFQQAAPPATAIVGRPRLAGTFLSAAGEKLYVRGVTYGAFRPREDGAEFPEPQVVDRDFALMAENGVNAVRTYTPPPRWLLDVARSHGLRVMVGLAMELYVGFLADSRGAPDLDELVRARVQDNAGHPALLCYAIGNEIPASVVRWHGARRIERYLERLYRAAKSVDPSSLVTYVNYPSTEYLHLPFLDLVCFNVYLEERDRLEAYLARLHAIAGDRPLLLTEIGLDSLRHGEERQAQVLDWQLRAAYEGGCAGAFVFAWTDEWYTSGADVQDWDFGLTTRERLPKPALAAVREAFAEVPFPPSFPWPKVSVVVCSYNGARTIRDCLEGLRRLDYANVEVIVVDDGSTDATAAIASEYDVWLIRTENRGLSSARNTGLETATGEIVAYIDDDARPDPHWLTYLAAAFLTGDDAGIGGPNIAPAGDGPIATCVANAPGGPTHVLLSDREAEHIPGCNMAFRKDRLQAIGGFDPRFRVAGDDVDICWRLRERGWSLGFSPAAMVWHHRRNSLRAYWRQQVGYGKAESLLERKWPAHYNATGHLAWTGRIYGPGLTKPLTRGRVYGGVWGRAPFQSLYEPAPGLLASLPAMPEWFLIVLALAALTALGVSWPPLLLVLPLLLLAIIAPMAQAGISAARAPRMRFGMRALTASLHLIQPLARLWGRLRHGLAPWRIRASGQRARPCPRVWRLWSDRWRSLEDRLESVERALTASGAVVRRGGDFDRWDLEVRGGVVGAARMLMGVEEHSGSNQLVRIRSWPRCSPLSLAVIALFFALAMGAGLDQAWIAAATLGAVAVTLAGRVFLECAEASGAIAQATAQSSQGEEP